MPTGSLNTRLSSQRKRRYNLAKEHQFRNCPQRKRRRVCGSYITEDIIITYILPRLPVISLLRFKSVCKSWYASITDPTFVAAHLAHSKNNLKLMILLQSPEDINLYGYEIEQGKNYATLLLGKKFTTEGDQLICPHLSNGLMLLNSGHYSLVLNPSTREVITLPECSASNLSCLYKDRAGLGYVHSSNVYKVAQYFYRWCDFSSRSCSLGFEVFTLGGDSSWRAVAEDPPYPVDVRYRPVSIGGAIYYKIDDRLHTATPRTILSFDLKDEKFESIPGPDCLAGELAIYCLQELEGRLCFLATGDNKTYELWMREDCKGHAWVHTYTINFPRVPRSFSVIAVRNGKLLIHIDGGNYHRLTHYHPLHKYFTTVVDLGDDFTYRKSSKGPYWYLNAQAPIRVIRYMESLELVTSRRIR